MIVVVGSVNLDFVARTPCFPRPGQTILGTDLLVTPGGKGANQALAVKRAGSPTRLVAHVGDDPWAESALRLLRDARVDLSDVGRAREHTGMAFVQVEASGENAITVFPGANMPSSPIPLPAGLFKPTEILLCQLEIAPETVEAAIAQAKASGSLIILNTAPLTNEAVRLAAISDIVISNEEEFSGLCASTRFGSRLDRQRAMAEFSGLHNVSVVVTLGADGAEAVHEGSFYSAAGLTITPVDTVGAGDTFCGFFAASLGQGYPFEIALRRATVAGSLACLTSGAQEAIPFSADVDLRLQTV
ncbi:hypothetical protein N185_16490 [Sinorhizobium sp. GW3]|nr:hypothetical protein N185_16490 [Sinorhizobium sp. GW3]